MSTSMHDWFITDMGPAETAQKIRETINPLFMNKMHDACLLLAEFMYASPFHTWNHSPLCRDNPKRGQSDQVIQADTAMDVIFELYDYVTELAQSDTITLSRASFGYSVNIMSGPNPGQSVFRVYAEVDPYSDELDKSDWCQDFSYWDNCDAPDDVSESDWDARRQFWNGLSPHVPISDMSVGFSHPTKISTYRHLVTNTDVLDEIDRLLKGRGTSRLE